MQRNQLSSERTRRLEELPGWTWNQVTDRWERAYEQLQMFAQREGHCLIRGDHVEGGLKLGNWVGNQRAFYQRGKLTSDRIVRLEAVPGWAWSLRTPRFRCV